MPLLFIRALFPSQGPLMTSSQPEYLLKAPSANTITWVGVKLQHRNLEEEMSVHSSELLFDRVIRGSSSL